MAHPAEQTDQLPHRDRREPSRHGETVSNGSFVNSLLKAAARFVASAKNSPRIQLPVRVRCRSRLLPLLAGQALGRSSP